MMTKRHLTEINRTSRSLIVLTCVALVVALVTNHLTPAVTLLIAVVGFASVASLIVTDVIGARKR